MQEPRSNIQDPASKILDLESCIQDPLSGILHPCWSGTRVYKILICAHLQLIHAYLGICAYMPCICACLVQNITTRVRKELAINGNTRSEKVGTLSQVLPKSAKMRSSYWHESKLCWWMDLNTRPVRSRSPLWNKTLIHSWVNGAMVGNLPGGTVGPPSQDLLRRPPRWKSKTQSLF